MKLKTRQIITALFLALTVSTQVHAMSFGFKICLASESEGKITNNGKALQYAKLVRKVVKDKDEYIDEVTTGENGKFSFPAIYKRSLLKHVPIQPIITQEVIITYEGKTHLAWELTKMDWDHLSEINSGKTIHNGDVKLFKVGCDLADKKYSRYAPNTLRAIHGKCLLEGEIKP